MFEEWYNTQSVQKSRVFESGRDARMYTILDSELRMYNMLCKDRTCQVEVPVLMEQIRVVFGTDNSIMG